MGCKAALADLLGCGEGQGNSEVVIQAHQGFVKWGGEESCSDMSFLRDDENCF